jgi:hypothetical protein
MAFDSRLPNLEIWTLAAVKGRHVDIGVEDCPKTRGAGHGIDG